jgi:hypothetical protein
MTEMTGALRPSEPRRPVSRRTFLKVSLPALGAGLLAATGAAAFDWLGLRTYATWQWRGLRNYAAGYRYAFLPPEEAIKRHFSDLTIDEAGLRRFLKDFEKHVGPVKLTSPGAHRVLYSQFLLSSDYYRNGADPKRTVNYVAYFDPYVSPCWNPFAPAA